jgi:K+/H+ antiporter YhaU regulatory subunit KhtT
MEGIARARAAQTVRLARDKGKKRIVRKAAKAEKTTEQNIIRSTVNSGRSNKDGDHIAAGSITLDTKMQSTRTDMVVHLEELSKVRDDATRAGNSVGGLVLRNKFGVGVVVIREDDFGKILAQLGDT